MVLRLIPQPSLFDDSIELSRNSTPVPTSAFYLRRPFFVPWTADPTTFILTTSEPTEPHEFIINRTDRISVVPGQEKYAIALQMIKGANHIELSTPNQRTFITVAATAVETWFNVIGREYYLSVGKRLTEIQNHFLTPWTTRAAAHLLPFTDLFLPARMPKIHQTRLAIMTAMGQRLGHGDGVLRMASAVSYSTPPVTKVFKAENAIPGADFDYPYVRTQPTTGEAFGRVLDIWTPNHCLASHQALFQLALAMGGEDVPEPKPLSLFAKDDRQVIVQYNGEDPEVHFLDPVAAECDDIENNTSCDASVRAFAQMFSTLDIMMMAPQLPFDETVEFPLNFGFYDEGNFFDASTGHLDPGLGGGDDAHDTVDPDDPFGTGFAGFSLSRRFDAPACLDTRIQVGRRLSTFVSPIVSTSPPALTPDPTVAVEGALVSIDAEAGAPAPTLGSTTIWATTARTFIYDGDYLRFENPDLETQIVSAWPVLDDPSQVIKSIATGSSQQGLGAVTSTVSPTGIITVTGLAHMLAESVGRYLTFRGAAVSANDGSFFISGFNSATSVDIDAAFGINRSGNAASMAPVALGLITVTGLTNMTLDSVGNFLRVSNAVTGANNDAFEILTFVDPTSVIVSAGAAPGADANNGILDWIEVYAPGGEFGIEWKETASPPAAFSEKVLTADIGFFGPKHESMGVEIDGSDLYTIVKVSDDGSQATIVGNPIVPATGVDLVLNVYDPLKDRLDDSEPASSTLPDSAGNTVYEIELTDPLLATLATGDLASVRLAPRVVGDTLIGVATIDITMSEVPRPGDLIFFDSGTALPILSALDSGSVHHTTGQIIYNVILDGVTASAFSDDEALFSLRADPCWLNGHPVTPLILISMAPTAYLTV